MANKYLIIGPSWVGDMVMSQCLYKLIKAIEPDAHIDVMAPDFCRPLLEAMPEVTEALALPFKHGEFKWGARRALGKSLKDRGYTHAIVLPNSWKSALVPFFAGIKHRIGWKGESRHILLNDCRKLDRARYPLMIQRFCALAYPKNYVLPEKLPMPKLDIPAEDQAAVKEKFEIDLSRPAIALCPGAEFGPAKQWPADYYAEVARQRQAAGYQVWIMGAGGDLEVAKHISDQIGEDQINFAGETSLPEAIAILSLGTEVVANDSGLMHISAALGAKLVVVYGSTSPKFTPPLSHRARIVATTLDCRPCFKRTCPLAGEKRMKCMSDLAPSMVINALDAIS